MSNTTVMNNATAIRNATGLSNTTDLSNTSDREGATDQADLYRFIQVKPEIDYLARDFTSLRQLMLDHFSVLVPQWTEESAADLGQLLIDLIAFTGDYLSYYQDAAATEAYLGTARLRRSVRRHARLLDYFLHEGCNARAWVHVQVAEGSGGDGGTLPQNTLLLTDAPGLLPGPVDARQLQGARERGADVFATLHDIKLHAACNKLDFYVQNARTEGILRKGATWAWLKPGADTAGTQIHRLLGRGDVLLFEEERDPATGDRARANPRRRHVVRLTAVYPPAREQGNAIRIEWAEDDALPFDLFLAAPSGSEPPTVARGNMVLADHGCWIAAPEELPPVPTAGSYRPALRQLNLTFCTRYDHAEALGRPARQAIEQDPNRATPQIRVEQVDPAALLGRLAALGRGATGNGDNPVLRRWHLSSDLLNSQPFAPDFVVEMEDGDTAFLGFGSGSMGLKPGPGDILLANYRVGNGVRGNVGQDTIVHLVLNGKLRDELGLWNGADIQVRNPLPARGGTNPARTGEARLHAPAAFMARRESCITAADGAAIARRYPGVAKAAAHIRWTGAWRTMFIYVRRTANEPLTPDFRQRLRDFLEPYRYVGSEIEIEDALYVPLKIELCITRLPSVPEVAVLAALRRTFDDQEHDEGKHGFFAPANFDFGDPVYRSSVIGAAMQTPGVANVAVLQFGRLEAGGAGRREVVEVVTTSPFEIVELRNDPAHPEHGSIVFTFRERA